MIISRGKQKESKTRFVKNFSDTPFRSSSFDKCCFKTLHFSFCFHYMLHRVRFKVGDEKTPIMKNEMELKDNFQLIYNPLQNFNVLNFDEEMRSAAFGR